MGPPSARPTRSAGPGRAGEPTYPCTHFHPPLPRHAKRPLVPTTPPPPTRCNRVSGRDPPPRLRRARRTRQRRASRALRQRRAKLYAALDVGRADHRPFPSPAKPVRQAQPGRYYPSRSCLVDGATDFHSYPLERSSRLQNGGDFFSQERRGWRRGEKAARGEARCPSVL